MSKLTKSTTIHPFLDLNLKLNLSNSSQKPENLELILENI